MAVYPDTDLITIADVGHNLCWVKPAEHIAAVRIAGAANIVMEDSKGVQIAGGLVPGKDDFTGAQLAGDMV